MYFLKLKNALHDTDISLSYGRAALLDLACTKVDWSMSAIVGFSGVEISLLCAEHSKILALANKEALVCAGKLLLSICKTYNTKLIPVDSEHSAIHQCLQGIENKDSISRLILTGSGGPFLKRNFNDIISITPKEAVAHPVWNMGEKITVDSSTKIN